MATSLEYISKYDANNLNNIFSMKYILSIIISLIIVLLYFAFQPLGNYGLLPQIYANIALIPVISTFVLLLIKKEARIIIFFLVIYQTWNMFLAPYLWIDKIQAVHRIINEAYIPSMSFFSALSVWTLYCGFFCFQGTKVKSFYEAYNLETKLLFKLCLILIVSGYVLNLVDAILSFAGIRISFVGHLISMLPATTLALYTLYFLRGGRNIVCSIIVIIYTLYNFIYFIGGTLFVNSIILVMSPLLIYIVERKKIPYMAILFIIILLMPIYLTRHTYRSKGLYAQGSERIAVGVDILKNEYRDFSWDTFSKTLKQNTEQYHKDNRFEGVSYLSTIVYCHNERNYPLLLGKTFAWLPTMVIPHFLMPFRPSQNMGDDWAEYYLLKEKSWKASINFPMLVEFYCNFGWLGMFVLSFFNGLCLSYICKKFSDGYGDINLLLLVFLAAKIVVVEVNITLTYGLILQVMFLCWIFKHYSLHCGKIERVK